MFMSEKTLRARILLTLALCLLPCLLQAEETPVVPPKTGKPETIELFNGKDLDGWEGHIPELWSVKDGVIVARNDQPVEVSTYLLTKKKFSDFRLTGKVKLVESEMHSGIAFWGNVAPEKGDPYTYAGHLVMFPSKWGFYDLYGRKGLKVDGEPARMAGKQHDWNELEILAQGNRIRLVVNGILAADWRDPEPDRIKEGPIGLQLHSNKVPQEVHFKDVVVTTFPEDKLTTLKPLPPSIQFWPEGAPPAKCTAENDQPSLTVFPAPTENANGTGVVICPGGGYAHLATGHEGTQIAEWFQKRGVTAFVLKYRLSTHGYQHPAPMLDVQRAIRTVRHRASEWNLNPKRIGVMGFSAGGHLASTASTHFDSGKQDSADPIDQVSCRPDFAILGYPVITLEGNFTHKGSRDRLLGDKPEAELIKDLSNDQQVSKDTPPTFLFHTSEDKTVPAENSVVYYLALKKHGVPAELHVYEKGRHGIGLAANMPATGTWPDRLQDWLKLRGLLDRE